MTPNIIPDLAPASDSNHVENNGGAATASVDDVYRSIACKNALGLKERETEHKSNVSPLVTSFSPTQHHGLFSSVTVPMLHILQMPLFHLLMQYRLNYRRSIGAYRWLMETLVLCMIATPFTEDLVTGARELRSALPAIPNILRGETIRR